MLCCAYSNYLSPLRTCCFPLVSIWCGYRLSFKMCLLPPRTMILRLQFILESTRSFDDDFHSLTIDYGNILGNPLGSAVLKRFRTLGWAIAFLTWNLYIYIHIYNIIFAFNVRLLNLSWFSGSYEYRNLRTAVTLTTRFLFQKVIWLHFHKRFLPAVKITIRHAVFKQTNKKKNVF